jgi:hypothetical protein
MLQHIDDWRFLREKIIEDRCKLGSGTPSHKEIPNLHITPGLDDVDLVEQRARVAGTFQVLPGYAVNHEDPERAQASLVSKAEEFVEATQTAYYGLDDRMNVV